MDSCETCIHKDKEPNESPCNECVQEYVKDEDHVIIDFVGSRWEDEGSQGS